MESLSIRSGAGQAFVPAGGENGWERSSGAGAAEAVAAWPSNLLMILCSTYPKAVPPSGSFRLRDSHRRERRWPLRASTCRARTPW